MTKTERILEKMTILLSPQKSRGVNLTYSFRFTGEEGGEFTLAIANGECVLTHGISKNATTLVECDAETWISISEKRLKPWKAAFSKRLKVSGSRLAMFRFNKLFSGDPIASDVPEHLFKVTSNEFDYLNRVNQKMKKVLVIQASQRGRNGATEIMLRELVSGLVDAGASVDIEHLVDLNIKNCTSCYACWKQTEGVCVQTDDMNTILSRIPEYDLMVFATPLYAFTAPALLKTFLDRCIPLFSPYIFSKNGRCCHPAIFPKLPNIALLSVCGFYEVENFDNLVNWLQESLKYGHMPLVASLLRPHSHILFGDLRFITIDHVMEATRQAGKELALTGRVSKKTRASVSQPIIPRPIYMAAVKKWWLLEDSPPEQTPIL